LPCCCFQFLLSAPSLRGGVPVTDGDTIVVKVGVDQRKIRLSGVDAPELAQDFGKASRAKRWQECCNSRKDRLLKGALANRFWRR
jgi:endonuclease YncB( thermonuclease family)